ncbi:MAG: F0F1 ATP synthase subunit A [Candidatus Nealsonbacteria bacterium]|nr:F0F1 ATP synthase subunit A [Candidatus Nealsonbacteria bacterium]
MQISFFSEKLFEIKGFPISNTIFMSWIAMSFLIGFSFFVKSRLKSVPGKIQNLVEVLLEVMESFMTTVTGDRQKTKKFFPLVATFFLFILISNWMGILPGVGSVGLVGEGGHAMIPFFRSTNSDINMTLALAVISVIAVQIFGVSFVGFFKYFSKFISFRGPIQFFTGILELIAEIAKIISFSFRLFGNIFAGEVLLMVIFFLVPLIVPIPFMVLEIFVGFVQALVFSMLTLVFLTVATQKAH